MERFTQKLISSAFLAVCLVLSACGGGGGGGGSDGNGGSTPSGAAITPVGALMGPPATTDIGTTGGTLKSQDGLLTLTIPAGALTSDTIIGIQSIANNAPGGLGVAYRLTPNGKTFETPVTLVYTPPNGQPNGSDLSQLGVAFQTQSGAWQILPASDGTADSGSGTYSVTTSHFTDYSFFGFLDLVISKTAAFVGQTLDVKVVEYDPVQVDNGPVGATFLPDHSKPRDFNDLGATFLVDGVAQPGITTAWGSIVTLVTNVGHYTAPAHLPTSGNPVAIGAQFTLPNGGPSVTLVKYVHLFAHKYHVVDAVMYSSVCGPVGGVYGPLDYEMHDSTSFNISLDDKFQITGSNFAAMPPDGPLTVDIHSGCTGTPIITSTATYNQAATDAMFVTSASGGYLESLGKLHLIVKGGGVTDIPAYHYVLSTGTEGDVPQSRSATDLEGVFLDGYDNETSPSYSQLPNNPNYDDNRATITVIQE